MSEYHDKLREQLDGAMRMLPGEDRRMSERRVTTLALIDIAQSLRELVDQGVPQVDDYEVDDEGAIWEPEVGDWTAFNETEEPVQIEAVRVTEGAVAVQILGQWCFVEDLVPREAPKKRKKG